MSFKNEKWLRQEKLSVNRVAAVCNIEQGRPRGDLSKLTNLLSNLSKVYDEVFKLLVKALFKLFFLKS